MARPNTDTISQSIESLRAESSPDSVTPARVANLLQAIVDLINALTMVPDSDVADIMQLINNAVSTANGAASTASAAQTAANNKLISQFKADAAADGVTITIKQSGHTAKTFLLPIADASQAGIILPAVLQNITDAANAAANNKLNTITLSYGSGITLTFKSVDNNTLATKTIPLVASNHHGLMSATDKVKLDGLPSSGIVALDAAGRVPAANSPTMMLRRTYPSNYDEDPLQNGEFFIDGDPLHVWYHQDSQTDIDMGVPSKNVVYCEQDTNILYRWTGSQFVPVVSDPNYAMQIVEVRRNNTTQKKYTIPNGVLANIIGTTDDVNIVLSPAVVGASMHRIIMYASNNQSVEVINWPDTLIWKDNIIPTSGQYITDCSGIMVTIYDMKFAEFNSYGR